MKRMRLLFCFLSIGLFLYSSFPLHGNEVRRGERPVIDLERIPDEAFEKGMIRILLDVSQEKALDLAPVHMNARGEVVFGIPALDELNRQFRVSGSGQTFAMALVNKSHTVRHRQWSLHLWYDLEIPSDADIRAVVKSYSDLTQVKHAEPVYRKELIGHVEDAHEPLVLNARDYSAPNDPRYAEQWHYHNTGQQGGTPGLDIKLPQAWAIQRGNPNVIVAVIDGGIAINHPDLAPNMWSGTGFNFVNNSPNIEPHNHGAHVAGTIAAVNNNGIGVSGVAGGWGTQPGVALMSLQVFAASSNGGFAVAPVWGADNDAALSQNSWGYTSQNVFEQAVLDAIDYFNVNGGGDVMDGGLTIFAAGNGNSAGNWYPGFYSGAMAVAATNNQDKKAWYSNYGSWVEISAPGGETNSVTQRGVLSAITGDSYAFYQGTSMACPHVTGVAALLLSQHPGEFTPDELRMILRFSADDHYAVNPSFVGALGTGRLNALSALQMAPVFLLMPKTPVNFTATTQGTTQVDVSWNLNDAGDDILLVFSQDGIIGSPENGVTYTAGQTLPGGGTVLLTGALSSFEHTGLEPGDYYHYRIWSKNDQGLYSLPSPTRLAITDCELFDVLPFTETFPVAMTPACWMVQDNQGNGQVWRFGTFSAGLQGTTGNYAYLNSDGFGSGNTQNSDLLSPVFDLSSYGELTLTFKHFYRSYSNSSGKLFISIDGGQNWQLLQTWTATTPNPTNVEIDLELAVGSAAVQLKWNYTGTYGYYWCIDDVTLTGVLSIPGAPAVITLPATEIDFETATLNAQLADIGNGNVFASGFVVSTTAQPVIGGTGVMVFNAGAQSAAGNFQSQASGLQSATRYYVRAWVENDIALIYGAQMQFTTPCDVFTLPFTEGFATAQLPYCWEIVDNIGAGQVWTVGSFSAGLQGNNGFYAYINSDGFGSGSTQNTDLITPVISLNGADAISVSFNHYFRHYSTSAGKFFYSIDGGGTWTQVQQWTGSTTPNPDSFSTDITGLTGNEQLRLRWNYTGTWGYSWNIDNIQVSPLNVEYYDLVISMSGQGTTVPAPGTYQYMEGQTVNLQANAQEGWEFHRWVVNGSEEYFSPAVTLMMDGNKSAVAHFIEIIPEEYTLTISMDGQGSCIPSAGEHVFQEGSQVDIEAVPDQGWEFVRWIIDGTTFIESPQHSIIMTSDRTANAVFTQIINEYTLTIDIQGEGTVNPGPGQYEYEEGAVIDLTATPASNFIFSKWVIDDQEFTSNPHQITILGNMHVVAHFSSTVDVAQIDGNASVRIYPNPGRDLFNVELSGHRGLVGITLSDIQGRIIASQNIEADDASVITFNVPGLRHGVYFIRVVSSAGVHLEKLMVQ